MKTERFNFKSCCGSISVAIKLNAPISKSLIANFVNIGFKEAKHFTNAGMLYVENKLLIVKGSLGSNTLQVSCNKKDNCIENINNLEDILKSW